MNASTPSALSGIRILDFSHVYQGPVGTQLLADYGADVIKVERPGAGDWSRSWGPFVKEVSLPFANLNRNKRSVTVDMKSPEGKAFVLKLVAQSDVLVHNFRAGVMDKLGLGYEALAEINPKLIYASSNGWGDEGPNVDRGRAGHDMMARAEGGWFMKVGEDRPPIPGGISVDYPSGLMLMQGILMALLHRERFGKGQRVSTDLLSVAFHAHAWEGASELNAERIDAPARVGGTEAAIDKSFFTADGSIEISPVFSDNSLRDISIALDLDDLSLRSEFSTEDKQIANRGELNRILAERFRTRDTATWLRELEAAGVLCARINTFREAAEDPQIAANKMVVEMAVPGPGSLKLLGTPVRLHGTPPEHRLPPPALGQHSADIAAELGYSPEDIASLQQRGLLGP
ncbi:MAG: CoA transferase [Verrucomicrobia bacterium]|nr:CoA transferase [Verrucomicrobiota bacterium]